MNHILIPVEKLKRFMLQAFIKSGVPQEDAEIVVDVLIASDLRGIESHGVGRLAMYLDRIKTGVQKPVTQFTVVRESPGTALVDGNHGMGQVIAYKAMKLAVEKAGNTGISAISVRNGTHFGIAGYYPLMAIKENMAGFAFTNSRPSVAPTFGSVPMFGTNPIAFGIPTDEECPFLLDMGTPIIQRGKVEVYDREGKLLPEGWVIDNYGNPLTNPTDILRMLTKKEASLLPLGGIGEETSGYKGYDLAVMVEMLSSAFHAGPFMAALSGYDEKGGLTPHKLGYFFMVIDISHFVDVEEFKKTSGSIVRTLRNGKKLPGAERIYTAGEKEFENEKRIMKSGVPINESLHKTMEKIARQLEIEI